MKKILLRTLTKKRRLQKNICKFIRKLQRRKQRNKVTIQVYFLYIGCLAEIFLKILILRNQENFWELTVESFSSKMASSNWVALLKKLWQCNLILFSPKGNLVEFKFKVSFPSCFLVSIHIFYEHLQMLQEFPEKCPCIKCHTYLIHSMLPVSFCTTWKHQKASNFFQFSGFIKRDWWHEMGQFF